MTRLIRVEVQRLLARRLVRVLVVLFFAIFLVVQVREFIVSDRNVAAARQRAEAEVQRQTANFAKELAAHQADCEAAKADGNVPAEVDCAAEFGPPTADAFFNDPRYSFARTMPDAVKGIAFTTTMIAFLVGASSIGAEWHAGTLQALLLWEPRRLRVLLAKAVALVGVVVAIGVAFQLFLAGSGYLIAALRGTTEGTTTGLWASLGLTALRGMYVAGFGALFGFGVAGIARVTGAALGAGFVYFAILENVVRGLRPGWVRYLVGDNIAALMENGSTITRGGSEAVSSTLGPNGPPSMGFHLSGQRAALTLAIYLAILIGAFAVSFQRRDVT